MAETAAAMVAATSGVRHLLQDYASFGVSVNIRAYYGRLLRVACFASLDEP